MRLLMVLAAMSVFALALLASPAAAQVKIKVKQIKGKKIKRIQIQPKQIQIGGFAARNQNGELALLQNKGVQKELELSKVQRAKIGKVIEKQKADVQALQGVQVRQRFKKIQEINNEAAKAAKEILDMTQGRRLGQLVAQQKIQQRGANALFDQTTFKDLNISLEQRKVIAKIRQKVMAELNKKVFEEMTKKLTPDQQKKLKELTGKAYKGVLPTGRAATGVIRLQGGGAIRPLPIQPKRVRPKKNKNGN